MASLINFQQPGYYNNPYGQQPLLQINLPQLQVPGVYQQPQTRTPWGDGRDISSFMNSQSAAAFGVASNVWKQNGGMGFASVGYSARRYASRSYSRVGNGLMGTQLGAALKSSLIAGAVVSTLVNGYRLMNNQQTFSVSITNIASDVVAAGVAGMAGSLAATAAGALLGGMLGPGLLLTLGTAAAGLGGIILADNMLRQSQMFQNFQQGFYNTFA